MNPNQHPAPATPMPETSRPRGWHKAGAAIALSGAALTGLGVEAGVVSDHLTHPHQAAQQPVDLAAPSDALPFINDPLPPKTHAKPTDIPNLTPPAHHKKHHEAPRAQTDVQSAADASSHEHRNKPKVTVEVPVEWPIMSFPEVDMPAPQEPRHLKDNLIPENVRSDMARNTAYIGRCSARLINDANGTPVGILTAEHCTLRDVDAPRILGTDGQYYMVKDRPEGVYTGDTYDTLKWVGAIDSYMLPRTDDTAKDLALGIFPGHTPEEVLATYKAGAMTEEQIDQLAFGDPIYMSGWPGYQPGNTGYGARQSFAMNFLGKTKSTTTNNETINIVLAAVKASDQGAMCSFGASGSEGMAEVNGQLLSVGALASFYDLTAQTHGTYENAVAVRRSLEAEYNVDLTGFVAVCGFAYVTPDAPEDLTVKVVPHKYLIPGFESEKPIDNIKGGYMTYDQFNIPQEEYDLARAEFLDTTRQHTVLNGMVELVGQTDTKWIKNPYYWNDTRTSTTRDAIIGWYDAAEPDQLKLAYYGQAGTRLVYDLDSTPGVEILTSTGELQTTEDSFVDASGLAFGTLLPNRPDVTNVYDVYVDEEDKVAIGGGFGVK